MTIARKGRARAAGCRRSSHRHGASDPRTRRSSTAHGDGETTAMPTCTAHGRTTSGHTACAWRHTRAPRCRRGAADPWARLAGAREATAAAAAGAAHKVPPRAASRPHARLVAPSRRRLDESLDDAADSLGSCQATHRACRAAARPAGTCGAPRIEAVTGKRPPATSGRQPDAAGSPHARGRPAGGATEGSIGT